MAPGERLLKSKGGETPPQDADPAGGESAR